MEKKKKGFYLPTSLNNEEDLPIFEWNGMKNSYFNQEKTKLLNTILNKKIINCWTMSKITYRKWHTKINLIKENEDHAVTSKLSKKEEENDTTTQRGDMSKWATEISKSCLCAQSLLRYKLNYTRGEGGEKGRENVTRVSHTLSKEIKSNSVRI